MENEIKIIWKDKYFAVVEKQMGIPCQQDKTGDTDLLTLMKKQFEYVEVVNRLDRPVGGIVLISLDKSSTAKLNADFSDKSVVKKYLTVVHSESKPNESGVLVNYLLKNQRVNLSKVVDQNVNSAKYAELEYKLLESIANCHLLEIYLKTGRHHQIRVQLSHVNMPIIGDVKYFPKNIKKDISCKFPALWSYYIEVNHPISNEKMFFQSFPNEIEVFKNFNYIKNK